MSDNLRQLFMCDWNAIDISVGDVLAMMFCKNTRCCF